MASRKRRQTAPLPPTVAPPGFRAYHEHTRGSWTGFLMGVPLTFTYALAIVFGPLSAEKRDFFIRLQISLLGENIYKGLQIGLAVTFIVLVFALARRGRFRPAYFGPLVVESMGYAAFASLVVWIALTGFNLQPAFPKADEGIAPVVSALGEAINQETFFRWILLEALFALAHRVGTLPAWASRALAVIVGTGVYASVGTFLLPLTTNDPVSLAGRFFTLAVSGLFFCVLYFFRGYTACAYTHVFYSTFWRGIKPLF
jgi:hypothetical protein